MMVTGSNQPVLDMGDVGECFVARKSLPGKGEIAVSDQHFKASTNPTVLDGKRWFHIFPKADKIEDELPLWQYTKAGTEW